MKTLAACCLFLLLAACAPARSDPAAATKAYLNALVEKNEAGLTSAVCAEWEADALLEYDAFAAVETSLANLDCRQTGVDGDVALVTCTGQIQATYSGEIQEFDLGGRTYRLLRQGEDWRVCGYSLE